MDKQSNLTSSCLLEKLCDKNPRETFNDFIYFYILLSVLGTSHSERQLITLYLMFIWD